MSLKRNIKPGKQHSERRFGDIEEYELPVKLYNLWPSIVEAHVTQTWSSSPKLLARERTSCNDNVGFIATRHPSTTILSPFLTVTHRVRDITIHLRTISVLVHEHKAKKICSRVSPRTVGQVTGNKQFILCGLTSNA